MIVQLMKRDSAWRAVWFVTPVAALSGLLIGKTLDRKAAVIALDAVTQFGLVMVLIYLSIKQLTETPLYSSLPVRLKDIYGARVLAMLAVLWIPVAALDFGMRVIQPLELAATGSIAAIVLHSFAMRGKFSPRWMVFGVFLYFGVATAAIVNLANANTFESHAAVAILSGCCIAGGLIFGWTWMTMPTTFQVAGSKTRAAASPAESPGDVTTRSTMPWRSLYSWRYLAWFPAMFLQMATGPNMHLGFLFIAFWWQGTRPAVAWLFALPVSRRFILASFLLPIVLIAMSGTVVSYHKPWTVRSFEELAAMNPDGCQKKNSPVPLDYWRVARNGASVPVRAPWGETFRPPVIRFYGIDIYNPYSKGCASSERFDGWQDERARETRRRTPGNRLQFLNVVFTGWAALILSLMVFVNDWHRVRRLTRSARIGILIGIVCAFFAVIAGGDILAAFHLFADSGGRRFPVNISAWLQWLSWKMPGKTLLLTVLPLPFLYLLVEKVFCRCEFSNQAPQDRWSAK